MLAVPVAPASTVAALAGVADDVVCRHMPSPFVAVGQWYEDFSPVQDDEVAALLERAGADDLGGGAGVPSDRPEAAWEQASDRDGSGEEQQ